MNLIIYLVLLYNLFAKNDDVSTKKNTPTSQEARDKMEQEAAFN